MGKMFAALIHFGDLWDWANKYGQNGLESFRFDMEVGNNVVDKCVEHQVDTIVFDISEGLIHEEYPEINFPGAWTNDQLRAEVQRLKKLGITMIPKYNFAVPHARWLGVYNREEISTPKYYEICKHVIEEAYEIFDHPAYIHLGFDEESPDRRTPDNFHRDKEMLFHDYKYIVDCVKATGARPCVWHSMFLYFDDTFLNLMVIYSFVNFLKGKNRYFNFAFIISVFLTRSLPKQMLGSKSSCFSIGLHLAQSQICF